MNVAPNNALEQTRGEIKCRYPSDRSALLNADVRRHERHGYNNKRARCKHTGSTPFGRS